MFEIKHRDAMGRIGVLEAKGKKVETPLILPVINPKIQTVLPKEIKKMGFPGVMTNSYIIKKDKMLEEMALKEGVHKLLGFKGLVMTDSGSYQLYRYGSVQVIPEEIVKFQADIGSNIGVILDIPTPPDVSYEKAKDDLEETIKRAKESLKISRKKMLLSGTIQGSTYSDLREKSATEMGELDFDVYPIGGVVPLMESYRFSDLVKVVMHSKKHLPLEKPVHLFGCGHPIIFALAAAMGCDIFDSAAYSLYAKDGRYIASEGTLALRDMIDFPCTCKICSDYTPKELLESEEREAKLAVHNLYATLAEIKMVKQSIYEGSLWELVEKRARNHPNLLEALRTLFNYDFLEYFDPVTKWHAFFYSGPESVQRPEVKRHFNKLKEIEFRARKLVLLPDVEKPYSSTYGLGSTKEYHVCIVSPVFGIIPLEVEDVYPLGQHEGPRVMEKANLDFVKDCVEEYSKDFETVFVHDAIGFLDIKGENFSSLEEFRGRDDALKVRAIADYQFGKGAGELLFWNAKIERATTGRIRRVYSGQKLLATLRASDGILILTFEGASRLLKMPFPKNRVVANNDAIEFVKEGKSVFAKFVKGCDSNIRPYQEVIIVDENDNLLATGTAILNGREMLAFKKGVAVKVRHKE